MKELTLTQLRLDEIRRDGGTQTRARVYEDWAVQMADHLRAGGTLPPIVVYRDVDRYNWLSEGFHRFRAHELAKRRAIECDLREGTLRQAILNALSSNLEHGKQLTPEDKRHAVGIMLADSEWSKWSKAEIAKQCGVSRSLVLSIIRESSASWRETKMRRKCKRGKKIYTQPSTRKTKTNAKSVMDAEDDEDIEAAEWRALLLEAAEDIKSSRGDVAALDGTEIAVKHLDAALEELARLVRTE
jgi:hypothetical protein